VARIEAVHRLPGLHFAVASWVQQLLKEQYGVAGAILLPNGVEKTLLDAPVRDRGYPPTVGLMYGRSPLKGAESAFEAIRLAQRQVTNLRTIAFGAATLHRRHRPPRPFEFHLRPAQEKLPMIYRQADCWMLPSTSEGFGMPGLEAAASRCPVIATRCGGPADYIREGVSGYLIDVGDVAAMARRLVEILSCDAQLWGSISHAAHEIAKTFTWDRSAGIVEQAIREQQGEVHRAEGSLPKGEHGERCSPC
jgi:glycosyltransferase involved in cell wall biosynthesis